jgi:hypothetical protein
MATAIGKTIVRDKGRERAQRIVKLLGGNLKRPRRELCADAAKAITHPILRDKVLEIIVREYAERALLNTTFAERDLITTYVYGE